MTQTLLVALASALAGCGCTSTLAGPYETKAQWSDERARLELDGADFAFSDIEDGGAFGTVFEGDSVVLRVENEQPYALLGLGTRSWSGDIFPPHTAIAGLDADTLVLAGVVDRATAERHGAADRYADSNVFVTLLDRAGAVRTVAGPPRIAPEYDWLSVSLEKESGGRVLAVLRAPAYDFPDIDAISSPPRLRFGDPQLHDRVYAFDGSAWTELPAPAEQGTLLSSSCLDDRGALWVAGTRMTTDATGTVVGRRGYAARFADGAWSDAAPPAPREAHVAWSADRIVCGHDGVWLSANGVDDTDRIRSWRTDDLPLLYRHDGAGWRQIALPAVTPDANGSMPNRYTILPIGLDHDGRVWIGYAREDDSVTDPLYRYDGERWETFVMPAIDNLAWYDVLDVAFAKDGRGWAIANLLGSAVRPESQGVLLRFDDGAWRLQNFNVPFWRKRWLALLG